MTNVLLLTLMLTQDDGHNVTAATTVTDHCTEIFRRVCCTVFSHCLDFQHSLLVVDRLCNTDRLYHIAFIIVINVTDTRHATAIVDKDISGDKLQVKCISGCASVRVQNENKNSSGDEIANVNFLRRYRTYVRQNTKKREPTSFNQLDDS